MSAPATGTLILIPAPLVQQAPAAPWLLAADRERVARLQHFHVETPKTARRWLRELGVIQPLPALAIRALPPVGDPVDWRDWLAPLAAGHDVGLMSDAGCPGVADPGSALVAAAHDAGYPVLPLVGPSSILLGLMASGLQGQRFAFHGYLPVPADERARAVAELARRSLQQDETQILIETPYRNPAMAETLLATLPASARLCMAQDLAGPSCSILTRSVAHWRRAPVVPDRRTPAVFLFHCPAPPVATSSRGPRQPRRGNA